MLSILIWLIFNQFSPAYCTLMLIFKFSGLLVISTPVLNSHIDNTVYMCVWQRERDNEFVYLLPLTGGLKKVYFKYAAF